MSVMEHLTEYLDRNHVRYLSLVHSPAYTSQDLARTTDVSGRQVAKAVLLKRKNGHYMMAVLEAPDHVRLEKLERLVGTGKMDLADEQDLQKLFPDCEIGAIPPFGNLYNLPVFMDEKLKEDDEIIVNAGTHRDAIQLKLKDFMKLVAPQVGSFT